LESVVDGSGKRQITYDRDSLDSETYVDDGNPDTVDPFLGYASDRNFDTLHRYGGLTLQAPGGTSIYQVGYEQDGVSRLKRVTFKEHTVTYAYNPANDTRVSMEYNNGSQAYISVAQNFDQLNRLKIRTSTAGSATKSTSYTYDTVNRRSKAILENGSSWDIGYDDRSQVTFALKKDSGGAPIPGLSFGYVFDDIGNRDTATANGLMSDYETNLLNQYTTLTAPQTVRVQGSANPSAAVTVEGQLVPRAGSDFDAEIQLAASGGPTPAGWRLVEIEGVLPGGGVNGADRRSSETREVYLPASPIDFKYDADGSLLENDKWQFSWDAENRLVGMIMKAEGFTPIGIVAASERKRLEFVYDAGGRRVVKKIYGWIPETTNWAVVSHVMFIYDGWNLIMETDGLSDGAVVRSYAWGNDLSGSLDGAGGVGGLVLAQSSSGMESPIFDGNGNVRAMVESSTNVILSESEYDPFGNVIAISGAGESSCPFGFSTKYLDAESGLIYFGFRYYNSRTGRWASRDPIGEEGGANIYGFVENAPTEWIDPLGLALYAFDGTNNDGYRDSAKRKETNVFALFKVYNGNSAYLPGVGTNDGLLNPIGSAFGAGGQARERRMLVQAREFVEKGDTVADITGFSRGAAQARDFANKLKEMFPCVKIRWIGLFDTVASMGLPNDVNIGYRLEIPHDTGSVLHLTAGGERRKKTFALSSIRPGPGLPNLNPDYQEEEMAEAVHSDVGGSYGTNRGLANQALIRMWGDGRSRGVPFGPLPVRYTNVAPMGTNDSRWFNDKAVEAVTGKQRVRKVYYHP